MKRPSKPTLPLLVMACLSAATILALLAGSFSPGEAARFRRAPQVSPESIFGVEFTPLDNQGGLAMFAPPQTATRWGRGIVIRWDLVEPAQGARDWAAIAQAEQYLRNAVSAGLEPVVVVRGTPPWAQQYPGYRCGPILPGALPAFQTFVGDLVQRYTISPTLAARTYEFWNEPDIDRSLGDVDWGGCWGDPNDPDYGGAVYGTMLASAYSAVKQANPAAQVLVGGLLLNCDPNHPPVGMDCTSARFIHGVAQTGQFDGVSFHSYDYYSGSLGRYSNPNWGSGSQNGGPALLAKARYLRLALAAHGLADRYLLNTENALLICFPGSLNCAENPAAEATKAYYLAQAYAAAIANHLKANIWFDATGTWQRGNGLLRPDLTPLPAYDAYRFASQELEGARLVASLNAYPGVGGYEFSMVNKHVWLAWSSDGITRTLSLPAPPQALFDVYGQPLTTTQQVSLSMAPIYIEMPPSWPRLRLGLLLRAFRPFTNGGFEQGGQDWSLLNLGLPAAVVSDDPQNDPDIPAGTASLLLGNPAFLCGPTGAPIGTAAARQTFSVPALPAGGTAVLEFQYIIYSEDASTQPYYDRFEVYVETPGLRQMVFSDGNQFYTGLACNVWRRVPGPLNPRNGLTTGWATGLVDLTPFQGRNVTVSFENYTRQDGWFNTYTYVDDVRLVTTP